MIQPLVNKLVNILALIQSVYNHDRNRKYLIHRGEQDELVVQAYGLSKLGCPG